MRCFFDELFEIGSSNAKAELGDINIFNVLFYGHEEVGLHSRFISYLLSLKQHDFLELFVRQILRIDESKFDLTDCEVFPNEQNKTEYENIDILIINEMKKQSIIIENKIHAEPSIHKGANEGYEGQLERYYNTIINCKDKNGKVCKYKCDVDKTYVYFLTLYKEPSKDTIGELAERGVFDSRKHKITYYQIQEWLTLCLENREELFLTKIIQQYLNLIIKMTTDNEKALAITNLISSNEKHMQSAYTLFEYFKHVKWHTIHLFFTKLKTEFAAEMPDENLITEVAHNNKKKILRIEFEYKGQYLQIVNDKNGFTLRNLTKKKWGCFDEMENIKFCDFSNQDTFNLISFNNQDVLIKKMVMQIDKHHEEGYVNLNKPFDASND